MGEHGEGCKSTSIIQTYYPEIEIKIQLVIYMNISSILFMYLTIVMGVC